MRAPKKTVELARQLRREMTLPEVLLWRALRRDQLGELRFRRQHPVGPFVLDFYCPSAELAIEIDGLAHDGAAAVERDERRTEWLTTQGVRVLRFNAADVLSEEGREGVLLAILEASALAPSTASRSPSPADAGEDLRTARDAN